MTVLVLELVKTSTDIGLKSSSRFAFVGLKHRDGMIRVGFNAFSDEACDVLRNFLRNGKLASSLSDGIGHAQTGESSNWCKSTAHVTSK